MGTSFTNFQVRSTDFERVAKALRSCHALPAFISKPSSLGWISVYPREAEKAEEEQIDTLALSLSRIIDGAVFAMRVYDSNNFYYVVYESGRFLDNYESDPGYTKGKELPPKGGNMRVLNTFCIPGTTVEILTNILLKKSSKVLETASVFWHLLRNEKEKAFNSTKIFRGEMLAAQLGDRLGLVSERIAVGYRAIRNGDINDKELVLLKDAEPAKPAAAAPAASAAMLMTETQYRARRLVDMDERPPAPTDAALSVAVGLEIGEELEWSGTVLNVAGQSKGIKLTLTSDALEQGYLTNPRGRVETWQSELDEETEYAEPDPADETKWPYYASFKRVEGKTVAWVAELPDLEYNQGLRVGLHIEASAAGKARLDLAIDPLATTGSSTAKFRIDLKVMEGEPKSAPTKSTVMRTFGAYRMTFPSDFDVSVASAQKLKAAAGIMFELRAIKDKHSQIVVAVSDSSKTSQKITVAQQLKAIRVLKRARNFNPSGFERITLGGAMFEVSSWECPDIGLYGIEAFAHDGGNSIFIRGETRSPDTLKLFQKAVNSFSRA